MTAAGSSYKGFRFPPEIISHCVWLYHRFPLSFRDVQELMFDCTRDQQPSLHPAGELADLTVLFVDQLHEVEQLEGGRACVLRLEPVVARVDQEVVEDGDLLVEVVLLRDNAHPRLHPARVLGHRNTEDVEPAGGRGERARDHPHRRGLAGAVRAEEAEARFGRDVEADRANGFQVAVALRQLARGDGHGGGHAAIFASGGASPRRASCSPCKPMRDDLRRIPVALVRHLAHDDPPPAYRLRDHPLRPRRSPT